MVTTKTQINKILVCLIFYTNLFYINSLWAVEMDCMIEPNTMINVSTSVEGIIDDIKVERGDTIKKGQVLATLESGVQIANLNLAKAQYKMTANMDAGKVRLAYAERKFVRSDELHRNKFISTDKKDDIETERKLAELKHRENEESRTLAKIQLESANATYKLRVITSPINGIVVDRFLSVGEFAQAQPIMKIASIDPLYIEVISHTQFYGHVKKGMKAIIKPEEPLGGSYEAVVTHVDHILDGASGTFSIRLEMDNKDYKIPAGAECKVIFDTK